jgi:CheY-like chemotaxis protein
VTRLFHFVQTAKGAQACDRIVLGPPNTETGFEYQASLGVVFRIGRRFDSMPEPPDRHPPGTITVLSVSTAESDHAALERTFRDSSLTLYPNCRLALQPSHTVASALAVLRRKRVPIVLCDRDEHPDSWREIIRATKELAAPPCVIVTSRMADDRQWAEILNAGAFDLLAKPFEKSNVIRILQSAWVQWQSRYHLSDTEGELSEPATGS